MKMLRGRLAKLERGRPAPLPEAIRAWLGERPPLTDEEEADWQAECARRGPPDYSTFPADVREWLGV